MSRSRRVTWAIQPHTLAKHAILRRYLDAWLPIMSSWNGRILYIDGFAGPGRYEGGEDGSPIIALKAALQHRHPLSAQLEYFFIEQDVARHVNLQSEIAQLALPSIFTVRSQVGRFDELVNGLLDQLARTGE